MNARQWRLAGALALTLGATLWASMQDGRDEAEELAASSAHASAASVPVAATGRTAVRADSVAPSVPLPPLPEVATRAPLAAEGAGFAAALSFRPPPPPPPPAPRPAAPPLPFRYVGAIEEAGERRALVMQGEQLRILRGGDEIDGSYRVVRVGDASIDFLYLPLKQRQSLPLSRS